MKMKKVAVILSGCGYLDGAEIRESVLTLLALDIEGIEYSIFAPDIQQYHVVNHIAGEPDQSATRNVLQEAGRIARGKISPITELAAEQFDGLLIPGGFGVAKNLSSFAFKGSEGEVEQSVIAVLQAFKTSNKPIGAICISPALLALTFGDLQPTLTIGHHAGTAAEIEKTGAVHQVCETNDCVVDTTHRLVTTPAYMDDHANLKDIFQGISKLVKAMVELSK
jgi:enhancing lycopene biosynthesis protein 2